MPCGQTNLKATFFLGIALAVLSFLSCLQFFFARSQDGQILTIGTIVGIIGVMIHCILIFGAHKRHSTAIIVWMVLAILECIGLAILVSAFAFALVITNYALSFVIGYFLFLIAPFVIGYFLFLIPPIVAIPIIIVYIILLIWTIIVAKNARKEIEADGSDLDTIVLASI